MVSDSRKLVLDDLQEKLGYRFKSLDLLNKSLTHKSYTHENKTRVKHNERFEFLGDSVLDLVVSEFMIYEYSDHSEGVLSKIRAAVVNESCLAEMARTIDLGRFLLLGKGEENTKGREKSSLLANAFEALAGALYVDGGLEPVRKSLFPLLKTEIEALENSQNYRDYKSDLQEYTQEKLGCIPSYKVVRESGPDHDKRFEVTATVNDRVEGKGIGRSKKEAEQVAAMMALGQFQSKND